MENSYGKPDILASSHNIILRDCLVTDLEWYLRWQSQGEWRHFDAPWESCQPPLNVEQRALFKKRFLAKCQHFPHPRKSATIALGNGNPLGWVNRYGSEHYPDAWLIGIDICEDTFLNKGYGPKALELWIDYLFTNSKIHRLGMDTWSFNPRMKRVAEKLGFVFEGAERELIEWQGKRHDRLHFGLLRTEWKKSEIQRK